MSATKIRQAQLRNIGGLTRDTFTQETHGFSVGNAVYFDGSVWKKALATSVDEAEVLGIIEEVTTDTFTIVFQGRIFGLTGLVKGSTYYLSSTTAGALDSNTPPETSVSKPILVALSTTDGVVVNWRGMIGAGGGVVAEYANIYSVMIGDGTNTTYVVTPDGMDTSKCLVQVSETSTGAVVGGPESIILGFNNSTQIQIGFITAPTTNQYRVTVVGR